MQIMNSNTNFKLPVRPTNKKKNIKNHHLSSATYLSKKFLSFYNLHNNNPDPLNHLNEVFMYFMRYKVEKINLIEFYNQDNSINLEFRVYPHYIKQCSQQNYNNLNRVISVNKFFLENYRYILI
ncbi:MAG: hypothetical protein CFH34_01018 [Alphaproteobacteria bacterium MarineAlpha9_Bin4]|nr:MAG: hypothetical protein CFH34_01018 [Alphaproteobacteria bacterium MarineAlpha9_Bin4]|tara:strand:+ start:1229 stop:1600 length:372 start_codon:yes stop_codon:yes gene_type:complete